MYMTSLLDQQILVQPFYRKNSKQRLAISGFHLSKWISNSKELMELIHADTMKDENQEQKFDHNDFLQEGLSYAKLTEGGLEELSDHDEHKVLGLNWNITLTLSSLNCFCCLNLQRN